MTKKQKEKFLELCKACNVKPLIAKYYEICLKQLIKKIHDIAIAEHLHDGSYWLVDNWILEYNRISGTEQSACVNDLKVGFAKSNQDLIDFIYDRFLETKKYRRRGWKKMDRKY